MKHLIFCSLLLVLAFSQKGKDVGAVGAAGGDAKGKAQGKGGGPAVGPPAGPQGKAKGGGAQGGGPLAVAAVGPPAAGRAGPLAVAAVAAVGPPAAGAGPGGGKGKAKSIFKAKGGHKGGHKKGGAKAQGQIIYLKPGSDLSFFDLQYTANLHIHKNDKVRFSTAWGIHNLFVAPVNSATQTAAAACDTNTIESDTQWLGVFCACNTTDACVDIRNSNNRTHNFAAPQCDDPALGLLALTLPGLGEIWLGPYDYQFTEPGVFWVVCTAQDGIHCKNGMKWKVYVSEEESSSPVVHNIKPSTDSNKLSQWGFYSYPTIHARKADKIRFRFFEQFHGILTSTVNQNGTDFPTDVPSRVQRCNQAGYKYWKGVPDAPETASTNYTFITYDLSIQDVLGQNLAGSFDVICSAGGPSHIPTSATDNPGHTHCVSAGMGFNVVVH